MPTCCCWFPRTRGDRPGTGKVRVIGNPVCPGADARREAVVAEAGVMAKMVERVTRAVRVLLGREVAQPRAGSVRQVWGDD